MCHFSHSKSSVPFLYWHFDIDVKCTIISLFVNFYVFLQSKEGLKFQRSLVVVFGLLYSLEIFRNNVKCKFKPKFSKQKSFDSFLLLLVKLENTIEILCDGSLLNKFSHILKFSSLMYDILLQTLDHFFLKLLMVKSDCFFIIPILLQN